jgi:hypothetical protein
MPDFDYPSPGSHPYDAPYPSPDSSQHLDHIRDELRNDQLQPPKFYGLNLGIIKLGFTSDGAFNPGINLGIVEAQAKVGLVNGAEAGVNLGPIVQAGAGAYAGVDKNGIFGQAKAGGEALTLVGATGHADARFGNATGVDGGASAHLGPIVGRAGAGAALGQDGLDATASGHARIGELANAHAGGHLGLNHDTQIGASAGAGIGEVGATAGAGIFSDGNAIVRPDVYVQGQAGQDTGSAHLVPPGGHTYADAYPPEAIAYVPQIDFSQVPAAVPTADADTPQTGFVRGPQYTSKAPEAVQISAEPADTDTPQTGFVRGPQYWSPATQPPGKDSTQSAYGAAPADRQAPADVPPPAPAPEAAQASAVPPPAKMEIHPLPEPPTPEKLERMDRIFRTVLCQEATYNVVKGDTYESIAHKLLPDADSATLAAEAQKLQHLHESGGFHSLRPGQHISTQDPREIDLKTRQMVADYFSLPLPQY